VRKIKTNEARNKHAKNTFNFKIASSGIEFSPEAILYL
jgi:hypothetical protein